MLYRLLRPLLFTLEAERAHELAVSALATMQRVGLLRRFVERRLVVRSPRLEQRLLGLRFAAPAGLAAGFDKNGRLLPAVRALGAGSLEVGTVTPRAQEGNPRPRMFRYPAQQSLQNALGFNNRGMQEVEKILTAQPFSDYPVGINIGKNRDTPLEVAVEDYVELARSLGRLAGYLVANVSSPNTPGLRDLQVPTTLAALVGALTAAAQRPVLVKISPDLEPAHALDLAEAAVASGAAGLIATNTTLDTSALPAPHRPGGVSGALLRPASYAMLRLLAPRLRGRCILVSVGGIDCAAEAYRRLRAGAALVQVYSGLVFRGPGLFRELHRGLLDLMDRDGLESIDQVVGADL
jgi:dihydroorotate dehydrogenase